MHSKHFHFYFALRLKFAESAWCVCGLRQTSACQARGEWNKCVCQRKTRYTCMLFKKNRVKRGTGEYIGRSTDLGWFGPLKSARNADFCHKLSGLADFEYTVGTCIDCEFSVQILLSACLEVARANDMGQGVVASLSKISGGGVLPHISYMDVCRCERYGFQAV